MREWSKDYMVRMLRRAGVQLQKGKLCLLNDQQWNELGDWAYYQSTGEKDHVPNRPIPNCMELIIKKKIPKPAPDVPLMDSTLTDKPPAPKAKRVKKGGAA